MTDSFLKTFVDYLRTRTDAPADFHLHAGMVALATALGNRVWCDGWARNIYPNLWVVVIAPSGYGKSVPLDYSRDLVEAAQLGDRVLPESFSQEALWDQLSKNPSSVFYLQEFASFMGVLAREYNAGLMSWITSLFDVPANDKRMLRGATIELKLPCISILGASSPDWFADSFKASALRGGFLARFLFCPQDKAGPYVGHPGPRNHGLEVVMADHLRSVSELAGRADLSGIWAAFNEWDTTARKRARVDCPPEFSGMRSRAGVLVLKAAMLYHVSHDPTNLRIERRDLDLAIRYVERAHQLAEGYLTDQVAHNRDDADRLRVMEIVRRFGGRVSRSEVLRAAHLSAEALDRAIKTLQQSDRLVLESGGGKKQLIVLTEGGMVDGATSREVVRTW